MHDLAGVHPQEEVRLAIQAQVNVVLEGLTERKILWTAPLDLSISVVAWLAPRTHPAHTDDREAVRVVVRLAAAVEKDVTGVAYLADVVLSVVYFAVDVVVGLACAKVERVNPLACGTPVAVWLVDKAVGDVLDDANAVQGVESRAADGTGVADSVTGLAVFVPNGITWRRS